MIAPLAVIPLASSLTRFAKPKSVTFGIQFGAADESLLRTELVEVRERLADDTEEIDPARIAAVDPPDVELVRRAMEPLDAKSTLAGFKSR